MNPETKLCLAAALNGKDFTREDFETDLIPLVTANLEDWFRFNPSESSQWFAEDRDAVLKDVEQSSQPDLLTVLQDMGFSVSEDLVSLNSDRWTQFIDEQQSLLNSSTVANTAKFPVEAVREILQTALDDEDTDQLALFWAAYLFGFDRNRVAGAEGTEDDVVLRFTSEEYRERALEEFQRLTGQD